MTGLDLLGRFRNCSMVDFDGDGRVDLFFANCPDFVGDGEFPTLGEPHLMRNEPTELEDDFHWLTVTVEGTTSSTDSR